MNDHPAPQQLPEVVRVGAGGWISGPSASIEPVPAEAIESGDFLLLDDGIQAEVTDVRLRLLLVSRRAGAGRVDRLAGRHVQRHVVPQGQRHPAPGHAVTISWRLTGSAKSPRCRRFCPACSMPWRRLDPWKNKRPKSRPFRLIRRRRYCSGACLRTFWLTR